MAKVLIVGGAGYVGGYMTDAAVMAGHEVRVIDNFFFGDITNFSEIQVHLKWADCVIWLAAFVGDPACAINPKLTMRTNVQTVKQLTENFGGRIIFPSTCSVYGAQNELLDESSPTSPLSLYAESKLEAEEILSKASNSTVIFSMSVSKSKSHSITSLIRDSVRPSSSASISG